MIYLCFYLYALVVFLSIYLIATHRPVIPSDIFRAMLFPFIAPVLIVRELSK